MCGGHDVNLPMRETSMLNVIVRNYLLSLGTKLAVFTYFAISGSINARIYNYLKG